MKVLWLTNIPSPYRVDFFNEFGKYCDLTVLFEKKASDERDESWMNFNVKNFKAVFLKGKSIKTDSALCFGVLKYIKKGVYDRIVVTNFSDATGIMAILAMKFKKIPFIVESDGGFAGSGRGLKEKIKKFLLKNAEAYFSTAKMHDEYYLTYGANADKIFRYPFTSLKNSDIISKPVTSDEKFILRQKLGVKEERVVLTVGQFIHRKGNDVLLKAARIFDKNTGFYFVGGVPTEEYLKYSGENIHFVGFKKKEDLKEYYKMADVFVLPTREDIWGLVINEAMACGLPVITTDRCIAGLELVSSDSIGSVVPVGDDVALSEKIKTVLSENFEIDHEYILKKIRNYTIEQMAKRHIEVFENFYNETKSEC